MSFKRTSLCIAALVALGGCANGNGNGPIGSGDAFLGEAVKYNAAVQTINPDPVYGPNGAKPGDNGDKGAAAVKRYRTDQVKAVEMMETTGDSNGSGSSPR